MACLVVTEVVTNALVHGGGIVQVDIALEQDGVRVGVVDRSAAMPVRRTPDPVTPSGRGVMLIELLSVRWGTELLPEGPGAKRVWFELLRTPPQPDQWTGA